MHRTDDDQEQGGEQSGKRRIFLVDDHPITRQGLADLIRLQPNLTVCGEAADGAGALTALPAAEPDLILLDLSLPDRHGLELVKDIHALFPQVLVLVFSMHDEKVYAERALHAGARGYVMKDQGGARLLEAIERVFAGEIYVSPAISNRILDSFYCHSAHRKGSLIGALTDREFEVFELLGQGLTTGEIAAQLYLSPKTVECHRLHIREKLGLKTGPELIKQAVRWSGAQGLV